MIYAIEVAQTVAGGEYTSAITMVFENVTLRMSREQAAELGNALLRANDEAFLRQE